VARRLVCEAAATRRRLAESAGGLVWAAIYKPLRRVLADFAVYHSLQITEQLWND